MNDARTKTLYLESFVWSVAEILRGDLDLFDSYQPARRDS